MPDNQEVRDSTLLLNVMGFLRDEELLGLASKRVFLDIDPGFPQMWHALGLHDAFVGHDAFVTIGTNIGQPACVIPTCGLTWITTPQPIVLERWPVAPGEAAVSLAMDTKNRRLFIGCQNKLVVIMNADNGKVVDKQPIGARVDASAFDPETRLVFCSNGEGTVTVIHQDNPDKYEVVETVKTQPGSKTMALDLKTHRLFVPAADFKAPVDQPKGRPVMVPKTFCVLIYAK